MQQLMEKQAGRDLTELRAYGSVSRALETSVSPRIIFDQVAPEASIESHLQIGDEQLVFDCGRGAKGVARVHTDNGQLVTTVPLSHGVTYWPCRNAGIYRIELENHCSQNALEYAITFTCHTAPPTKIAPVVKRHHVYAVQELVGCSR